MLSAQVVHEFQTAAAELTREGLLSEQGPQSACLGLSAAPGGSRPAAEQACARKEGRPRDQGSTSAVRVPGGL